jgi:hypothetical protein
MTRSRASKGFIEGECNSYQKTDLIVSSKTGFILIVCISVAFKKRKECLTKRRIEIIKMTLAHQI